MEGQDLTRPAGGDARRSCEFFAVFLRSLWLRFLVTDSDHSVITQKCYI